MIVEERTGGEEAPKIQIARGMLNMEAKSCAKKGVRMVVFGVDSDLKTNKI